MKYEQLGDLIYIPEIHTKPLLNKQHIKFSYYISTRVIRDKVEMDITTKLFNENQIYIRKACYLVSIGQLEKCVKKSLIEHMCYLGVERKDIPESLVCKETSAFFRK